MKQSPVIAEILFSAAEVAKAAGVAAHELQNFEPSDFGSPGHWRMNGGVVVYTVKGIERLADGFAAMQHGVEAHSLRVLAKQRVQTPSSATFPSRAREPYYRKGDLG